MPIDFEITAQLQLQAPNVGAVAADISRQLARVNPTLNVNTTGANSGVRQLTGNATAASAAMRSLQDRTNAANASLVGSLRVTTDLSGQLGNLASQAGLAARRFIAFSVASAAILGVVNGFKNGVKSAVDFDLAMNKVAQVSSETGDKVGLVRKTISDLSTTLGVSSASLGEAAITIKQAGLSADETSAALKALALTDLAPTFDNMAQSAEGLIAALRQFKLQSKDYETTLGAMNAVSAEFAVESSDLISAVQRAGGAFRQTGGSLNEFLGLFTAVRATTREGADTIATGLRTIFTRLQRNDTVTALKDLGINLRYTADEAQRMGKADLTNQFVGAYDAVRRLSEGLEGLRTTDPRYSAVIEQLGGYRQISRVIPLLKQFEDAEKAKNIAIAGGISLQATAEKRQEALANKIDKLKETYLDLFRRLVDSNGFKGLANSAILFADGLAKVLEYVRPLVPLLTTLAAIKVAGNLGTITGNLLGSFSATVGSSTTLAKPRKFASGGVVPGVGNTDSVPMTLPSGSFVIKKRSAESLGQDRLEAAARGGVNALLMPGERVFSPDEARRIGRPTLEYLNANGRVPGYAFGGSVKKGLKSVPAWMALFGGSPEDVTAPSSLKDIAEYVQTANNDRNKLAVQQWSGKRVQKYAAGGLVRLAGGGDPSDKLARLYDELSRLTPVPEFDPASPGDAAPLARSVREYVSGNSVGLNRVARGGADATPDQLAHVRELRRHVARGSLPADVTAFRGIDAAERASIETQIGVGLDSPDAVGRVFRKADFGSFSLDRREAEGFADGPGSAVLTGVLPAGGRVAALGNRTQQELLTQLGSRFVVEAAGANPTVRLLPHVESALPPDEPDTRPAAVAPAVPSRVERLRQQQRERDAREGRKVTLPSAGVPRLPLPRSAPASFASPAGSAQSEAEQERQARAAIDAANRVEPDKRDERPRLDAAQQSFFEKYYETALRGGNRAGYQFGKGSNKNGSSLADTDIESASLDALYEVSLKSTQGGFDKTKESGLVATAAYRKSKDRLEKVFGQGDSTTFGGAIRGLGADGAGEGTVFDVADKNADEAGDIAAQAELARRVAQQKAAEQASVLKLTGGVTDDDFTDKGDLKQQAINRIKKSVEAQTGSKVPTGTTNAAKLAGISGAVQSAIPAIPLPGGAKKSVSSPVAAPNTGRTTYDLLARAFGMKAEDVRALVDKGDPDKSVQENFAAATGRPLEEVRGGIRYSAKKLPPPPPVDPASRGFDQRFPNEARYQEQVLAAEKARQRGSNLPAGARLRRELEDRPDLAYSVTDPKNPRGLGGVVTPERVLSTQEGKTGYDVNAAISSRQPGSFGSNPADLERLRRMRAEQAKANDERVAATQKLYDLEDQITAKVLQRTKNAAVTDPLLLKQQFKERIASAGSRPEAGGILDEAYGSNLKNSQLAQLVRQAEEARPGSAAYSKTGVASLSAPTELFAGVARIRGDEFFDANVRQPAAQRRGQEVLASLAAQKQRELERQRGDSPVPPEDRAAVRKKFRGDEFADPLALKQAALAALRDEDGKGDNQYAPEILDQVRGKLNAAQFAQVQKEAERQGFAPKKSAGERFRYEALDTTGGEVKDTITAANREEAERRIKSFGYFATKVEALGQLDDAPKFAQTGGKAIGLPEAVERSANENAQKSFAAKGGASVLSTDTKNAIQAAALAEEETKVRRELTSAQRNLLTKLNPAISTYERNKIAAEQVEQAMQGLAPVVKSASGKILGLQATVQEATAKGVNAAGAGGFGFETAGKLKDRAKGVGKFLSTPGRLAERADGFASRFGGLGTVAAVGASYGASLLDPNEERLKEAVASGNTSGYSARKGASGALQSAVVGATAGAAVGSVVPVVGTAIGGAVGAVAGGLYGLRDSLHEADRDIKAVQIGNTLKTFGDRLSEATTRLAQGQGVSGSTVSAIAQQITSARAAQEALDADAATHTFGGFNGDEYGKLRTKSEQQLFAGQLPSLLTVLTKQAEQAGRGGVGKNSSALVAELLSRNGGANRTLLDTAARARGVTALEQQEDLVKSAQKGQQSAINETADKSAREAEQRTVNTFGRLASSVQVAADSLIKLRAQADVLQNTFDGVAGVYKVNLGADKLGQLGRGDKGVREPLDLIAAVGGDQGAKLRRSGLAVDAVGSVLPGVLAQAVSAGPASQQDIHTAVSQGLADRLGYGGGRGAAPPEVQEVINSITRQLNELTNGGDLSKVLDEVHGDVSKFSENLLSGSKSPVEEYGGRFAAQVEGEANRFVEELSKLTRHTQAVAQNFEAIDAVGVQKLRLEAQFRGEDTGRRNQAAAEVPLAALLQPFQNRQERLTGLRGASATDAGAIGTGLRAANRELEGAVARQAEVAQATGGKGDAFTAAAENVRRLSERSANLTQALKNLADVSTRAAAIQEKLSNLQQEKDSRLGLAERYATGTPEELGRLNRGFAVAKAAAEGPGNLDRLTQDDRRAAIESLRAAGTTTLVGVGGAPRADDLLRKLLENSFGGAFKLTGGQQKEEADLRGQLGKVFDDAKQANQELIRTQQTESARFFTNLAQQHAQFFAALAVQNDKGRLTDAQNAAGVAGREQGAVKEQQAQQASLRAGGVTTTAQVVGLKEKKTDVEDLGKQLVANADLRRRYDAAIAGAGKAHGVEVGRFGLVGPARAETYLDVLGSSGLDQKLHREIAERAGQLAKQNQPVRFGESRDEYASKVAQANEQALRQALTEAKAQASVKGDENVLRLRENIGKAVPGLNQQTLENSLTGQGASQFLEALEKFGKDNPLETLGTRAATAGAKFDALNQQVEQLTQALAASQRAAGQPVQSHAFGGAIFSPKGTDTVPAMLTPNEFVVNAKSAQANLSLLKRINQAKGPLYRADGGPVGGSGYRMTPYGTTDVNGKLVGQLERVKEWDTGGRTTRASNGEFGGEPSRGRLVFNRHGQNIVGGTKTRPSPEFVFGEDIRPAHKGLDAIDETIRDGGTDRPWLKLGPQVDRRVDPLERYRGNTVVPPEGYTPPVLPDALGTAVGRGLQAAAAWAGSESVKRQLVADAQSKATAAREEEPARPEPSRSVNDAYEERERVRSQAGLRAVNEANLAGDRKTQADAAKTQAANQAYYQKEQAQRAAGAEAVARANAEYDRRHAGDATKAEAANAAYEERERRGEVAPTRLIGRNQLTPPRERPDTAAATGGSFGIDDEVKFLATANRFGATAQYRAKVRVGERYDRAVQQGRKVAGTREDAVGRAATRFSFGANAALAQRQAVAAAGVTRPGADAQRSITSGQFSRRRADAAEVFKKDYAAQGYVNRTRGVSFAPPSLRFAHGGIVPGTGTSDSVHAMLTPGEGVLTRDAVQRLGSGAVQKFNKGGVVGGANYLAAGGPVSATGASGGSLALSGEGVQAMSALTRSLLQFSQSAGGFGETAKSMTQAFTLFNGSAKALSDAINSMPKTLTGSFSHSVTVVHNGAEVFAKLTPAVEKMVVDKVNMTLNRVFKDHLPEAGVPVE